MYGRAGLDRFKKAQSSEPFSVNANSSTNAKPSSQPATKPIQQPLPTSSQYQQPHHQNQHPASQKPAGSDAAAPTQQVTQVGGGQSTWQPPDWAIEPRPGVYYLEVIKDGEVLDRINLDRRRQIFGRQFQTCDFVLDHQSVSRQHAAVIPHKNGRYTSSLYSYLSAFSYVFKHSSFSFRSMFVIWTTNQSMSEACISTC